MIHLDVGMINILTELWKTLKKLSNNYILKRKIGDTNTGNRQLENVMMRHELWGERILPFKMEVNVLQYPDLKDLLNQTNGEGTSRYIHLQINAKAMEKVVQWQMKFM